MRTCTWVLATVACLAFAGVAQAERIYSYEFGASHYNVPVGESVDVQVFLVETLTDGETSELESATLATAGVRISYVEPVPANRATMPSPPEPNLFGNPQFDAASSPVKYWPGNPGADLPDDMDGSGDLTPIAGMGLAVDGGAAIGVAPQVLPDNRYRIPLGTFRFTAGSEWYVSTTLRATDLLSGNDDTVLFGGGTLDGLILTAEVVIATIPEPAALSLGVAAMLAGSGFFYLRRRRATR